MEEIRDVDCCPHCGNKAPQKLLYRYQFVSSYIKGLEKEGEYTPVIKSYFVCACETCNELLLRSAISMSSSIPKDTLFITSPIQWPNPNQLHESVPESIKKIYDEAIRIRLLAPNAFAVQIRRALEAMCKDRGAKKGTLQVMLKELAGRGEIPPVLAEMTDVLRLLGNIGAHASNDSVTTSQARAINEFFRAVIEYVYIAPSKLKEFRDSLKKAKGDAKDDV